MRRLISIPTIRRFLAAQEGATAIEYALIASGIAGVLVATLTTLGGTVSGWYMALSSAFQ